jgi:hypothetical protein
MASHRMTRVVWLAIALMAVTPFAPSMAQTTGTAPEPGIGLTADHKRTIYQEVGQEQARRVPDGSRVAIGAEVPDSLMLNEMPISLKDKVGLLRDFKFAKLPDDTILIVDPAKRQIVDLVTKDEGTR